LHVPHTASDADSERRSHSPAAPALHADDLEREIDLTPYLAPLLRRWPLLLALTVLGAVVGLVISGRGPIMYEASTTVLVQQAESAAAFSTARALLRNHTLAAETLTELGLAGEPYNLTPQRFIDGALAVDEVGGTHLLHVKVRLPDAALAATASHALSSKAVELNRRVRTEGATAVRQQLKAVLDDAAVDLQDSEEALLAARTRTQLDVLKKDAEVMLESRASYQQLLVDIEGEKARLAAAEAEMLLHDPVLAGRRSPAAEEALRRAMRAPTAEIPGRASPQPPATGIPPPRPIPEAVEAVDPELLDLSQPSVNPVFQTLAFQIATSRILLANMERRRRELAGLHGAGASPVKPFTDLYRAEIEIARLEDRYEQARRTYRELAARYEQSRTDAIGRTALLQIVDPAVPPERPVSRRRAASMIAGALGGLLLATTLALALGRRSRSLAAASSRSAADSRLL
jgi:polysaccharide biosynthesis transport protein